MKRISLAISLLSRLIAKQKTLVHEEHYTSQTRFRLLVFSFGLMVFVLNFWHLDQQNIYLFRYLPMADSILHGAYTFQSLSAYYPIWGYPMLCAIGMLIGSPEVFLLALQFALAVYTVLRLYASFGIVRKTWHIPLLLPYFALLSVKWPDAIVAGFLVLHITEAFSYLRTRTVRELLSSAVALIVVVNFRTEYLLLPIVELAIGLIYLIRHNERRLLTLGAVAMIAALIGLSPWALRSFEKIGKPMLVSTNGGSVALISLGQLPNNPWHIINNDTSAFGITNRAGIADPYSPIGDAYLEHQFVTDIESHPISFVAKVSRNTLTGIVGGLYTGEFAGTVMNPAHRDSLVTATTTAPTIIGKIKALGTVKWTQATAFVIEKLLRVISVPFFFYLLLLYTLARRNEESDLTKLWWLLLPLVLYRFATVAAIQYESRHMNAIYLPLLGYALLKLETSTDYRRSLTKRALSVFR